MISELSINEFHRTLNEMTVEGTPSYKGSFFAFFTINSSNKPFYGYVSKSEFAISKNSNIKLVPFTIRGNYKKNGDKTEVDYEIQPIKFGNYWIKFMPISVLLISIFLFLLNINNKDFVNSQLIIFILFTLFFSIFANVDLYLKKKNFEKLFLKTLKINNI